MTERDGNRTYSWGHERRFNASSNYFRSLFGTRVQKVSVDAGFSCPNRDGTKARGGCTYCDNNAFNPSYCSPAKSVTRQLEEGIRFLRWRYRKTELYLAYFQAYSNTYAPLSRLKELYQEALDHKAIIGLVIGTRPDCIDDEKLEYLRDLSERYYVSVEYGIESFNNETLERINRQHTYEEAVDAVRKTAALKIHTGAHFIFGLPGESEDEMLGEAALISRLPLTTVKFHQLQIIKGTVMAGDYRDNPGEYILFTWEKYRDFIISFLERLTPEIIVDRFSGEAPLRFLEDVRWGKKRSDQITELIEKRLDELDTWQGRLYRGEAVNS